MCWIGYIFCSNSVNLLDKGPHKPGNPLAINIQALMGQHLGYT